MTRPHLKVEKNLKIDGVDTTELAKKHDTPLYVTSGDRIKQKYRKLKQALQNHYPKIRLHYACKANTNINILKILEQEGCHIDAVSTGEIYSALKAGYSPEKILYTGTSVSNQELKYAADKGVMINLDSAHEMRRLSEITSTKVSFRVNPGVGAGHHDHCITGGKESKFGIWEDDIIDTYKEAIDLGLTPIGIHMHIGSGILEVEKFRPAVQKMMELVGKITNEVDIDLEFIDIGGGLGIPYKPNEKPLNIDKFAEMVTKEYKKGLKQHNLNQPILALEPGRYLVGDSSILLTKVNDIKENPFHRYIGIDAGFNTLQRPAMYGSHHGVVNASNPKNAGNYIKNAPKEGVDRKAEIAGPLCESGDIIAQNREITAKAGDILAILDTGAYGYSMASRYNSRPLPAEILIENGETKLIRERETHRDLLSKQKTN
ncbi:Diaminopimelate decarboxylase, LysA [Methanonatronarchaeum thermophilum]|uniref:Diaminopimelate decarboxylase n=1 Tax=Methanonatronarchaeum thermophilum TaxID=1927129 RepID=A0A1Y3GCC9_9EURY|nr:diaminopimelate decarboxylase [Methanonatronarchaeum thermophilum]OUJ19112.1 Diaminopimelate decarboxylase, LysA [Methanonatronarchaeum thermophilum]